MRFDALEDIAAQSLVNRLLDAGWRRVDQDDEEPGMAAFSRQEVEEVAYDLGVGWQVVLDGIRFRLSLGVRHFLVADLVSRFMGYADGGVPASTFGRSLIDMLPHVSPIDKIGRWLVRSRADVNPVTETAIGDLENYGMPFLRSFRNLGDVISYLEAEERYQVLSGHLAVAYGIASRQAQAESALREYANASQNQQGSMLRQSQKFISGFVEHFGFGSEFVSRSH